MFPSQSPLHDGPTATALSMIGVGSVIRMLTVVSQPNESVMVTFQAPAQSPLACGVFCPIGGGGDHA
jgi:hypothetical protein